MWPEQTFDKKITLLKGPLLAGPPIIGKKKLIIPAKLRIILLM